MFKTVWKCLLRTSRRPYYARSVQGMSQMKGIRCFSFLLACTHRETPQEEEGDDQRQWVDELFTREGATSNRWGSRRHTTASHCCVLEALVVDRSSVTGE